MGLTEPRYGKASGRDLEPETRRSLFKQPEVGHERVGMARSRSSIRYGLATDANFGSPSCSMKKMALNICYKSLDFEFALGGALGGSWVAGLGSGNTPQDHSFA